MKINIKGVLKCTAIALAAVFLLIFLLAVLAYFTDIGEDAAIIGVYIVVVSGAVAGSFLASKAADGKKIVHSLLFAVIYACVLLASSAASAGSLMPSGHTLGALGGIFAAAILGAVIGSR